MEVSILYYRNIQNIVILISGPSLLYVFKKWSEFTLKVVRVYLKSGPSLLVLTNTGTIIFSRHSYHLSITHPFLLYLPTSQSITTLSFTITSNLDYSPHINNMIRTTNYFLYNIRKSRYKLTFAMTKCLIHSLVFSKHIYYCSLLCNLPENHMYKLEHIQRRAIRVLYTLNFASIVSISALMISIGWLKFKYICKHKLFCITNKDIHLRFSEYLAQYIIIQSYNRSSRKCYIMKLVQRSPYLAYSKSPILVIAPKSWNSLPYYIHCTTSLSLFKL